MSYDHDTLGNINEMVLIIDILIEKLGQSSMGTV